MKTVFRSPSDKIRLEFLHDLESDLKRIGNKVSIAASDDVVEFEFTRRIFPTDDEKLRAEMRQLYDKVRRINLISEKEFIERMESDGILDELIDGKDVNPEKIRPEIRICGTDREKNAYRYYRQFQKIPNSSGVGRRFSALVYDVGQSRPALMGVIGLAGTAYTIKDRDDFLGWQPTGPDAKAIKDAGLRRIMELSVCMAVPPYNHLNCSKLVAALSLSDPIQNEFQERYHGDALLALITTGATGKHAPMFNRIRLNQVTGADKYKDYNNEMFSRIGETSEKTTMMLTAKTIEQARKIAEIAFPQDSHGKSASFRSPFNKTSAVQRILRLCNISSDVLNLIKKSLYIAYLCDPNIELLRIGKQEDAVLALDVNDVTEYWKRVWLRKAIESREDMEGLRRSRRNSEKLSRLLQTTKN